MEQNELRRLREAVAKMEAERKLLEERIAKLKATQMGPDVARLQEDLNFAALDRDYWRKQAESHRRLYEERGELIQKLMGDVRTLKHELDKRGA